MSIRSVAIACTAAAALAAAIPTAVHAQDNGRIMQRPNYDRSGSDQRNDNRPHVSPEPRYPAPEQVVRIWPRSGPAGSDISVSGWGFAAGVSVSVLVGDSPTRLSPAGSSTSDSRGEVRTGVQVPGWARPGSQVYVAIQAPGQRIGAVSGPFYVTQP